jgi:hypothetical protein
LQPKAAILDLRNPKDLPQKPNQFLRKIRNSPQLTTNAKE